MRYEIFYFLLYTPFYIPHYVCVMTMSLLFHWEFRQFSGWAFWLCPMALFSYMYTFILYIMKYLFFWTLREWFSFSKRKNNIFGKERTISFCLFQINFGYRKLTVFGQLNIRLFLRILFEIHKVLGLTVTTNTCFIDSKYRFEHVLILKS